MKRLLQPSRLLALVLLAGAPAGCDRNDDRAASTTSDSTMPAGWKVTSDLTVSKSETTDIAKKLGGEIASLRNTVYDVDGTRVQLNTIVATDEPNAERILAALRKLKDEVASLRDGATVYEFVGTDDALPAIRAGRDHLAK